MVAKAERLSRHALKNTNIFLISTDFSKIRLQRYKKNPTYANVCGIFLDFNPQITCERIHADSKRWSSEPEPEPRD